MMKITTKDYNYKKVTLVTIISAIYLCISLLLYNISLAQSGNKSYFEQQGNKITIEAEHALGYGWREIASGSASEGFAFKNPRTDTLIIPIFEDTYIDRYNSGTTFGTSVQLLVDGKGGNYRCSYTSNHAYEKATFLKFEVTGLISEIIEAKVYMYCEGGGVGGGIYSFDPLIDNLYWSESNVSWDSRPVVSDDANTFQDYISFVDAGNWYAFDVTSDLSGKMNGVYSYALVMQENNLTKWSSKEGSNPPYLMLRVETSGISISGNVSYYSNENPIMDAKLDLSGGEFRSQNSDQNGYYNFLNLVTNKNYTINASKTADTDIGDYAITTYDAALTAQAAVGIRTLTDHEYIAADVSRDGIILTYDAALIAQYSVGLPRASGSHVAEWEFLPESYFFESLNSDQTNQNFTGIILGNVHGGWSQSGGLQKQTIAFKDYMKLQDISAKHGEEIEIPLEIKSKKEIISAYIDFYYDANILKFKHVYKKKAASDMEIVYNNEPGRIRIGAYSIKPIVGSASLFNLAFYVTGETNSISELLLDKFQLNNDIVMKAKSKLYIEKKTNKPLKYKLEQNYPNPFFKNGNSNLVSTNQTLIKYQLPHPGKVTLTIYNFLGQKVRTLVDVEKAPGTYSVLWDGRNDQGEKLSVGIYFYRFIAGKYIEHKRMILL